MNVGNGFPGEAITYTLHLTNTGKHTDTFDITIGGHTWTINAPLMVGPLGPVHHTTLDIVVNIPMNAIGNTTDVATFSALSQGSSLYSATTTLTTTAVATYGALIQPDGMLQSGVPGETITYTLQVTNIGNFTDTFDVVATDYAWSTSAPAMVGPLRPEERLITILPHWRNRPQPITLSSKSPALAVVFADLEQTFYNYRYS